MTAANQEAKENIMRKAMERAMCADHVQRTLDSFKGEGHVGVDLDELVPEWFQRMQAAAAAETQRWASSNIPACRGEVQ